MLRSEELTKAFGAKTAVDHVNLHLEAGHICAMLGPNGSGKTTWMKMAAGLCKPTSGTVYFEGEPVGVNSRASIAYMSTEPYFYTWMTLKDVGRYYGDFFADYSAERYRELLDRFELEEGLKTKTLSSGMMAKAKIAVTLARDAKVWMLDEPFNGIDLVARDRIKEAIISAAAPDKLLLMSSHLVEEMESIADRAVFLRKGKLIKEVDIDTERAETGCSIADEYRRIYGGQEEEDA